MLMFAAEASVATAIAREEIAEKKRIEEEKRQLYIFEVTAKTIEYCETTLAENIEAAIKRGYTQTSFYDDNAPWFSNENSNGIARMIKKSKTSYANGDPSFYQDEEIIPNVMIEYLTAHGYKVTKTEEYYRIYGAGSYLGYKLKISWGN